MTTANYSVKTSTRPRDSFKVYSATTFVLRSDIALPELAWKLNHYRIDYEVLPSENPAEPYIEYVFPVASLAFVEIAIDSEKNYRMNWQFSNDTFFELDMVEPQLPQLAVIMHSAGGDHLLKLVYRLQNNLLPDMDIVFDHGDEWVKRLPHYMVVTKEPV